MQNLKYINLCALSCVVLMQPAKGMMEEDANRDRISHPHPQLQLTSADGKIEMRSAQMAADTIALKGAKGIDSRAIEIEETVETRQSGLSFNLAVMIYERAGWTSIVLSQTETQTSARMSNEAFGSYDYSCHVSL